MSVLMLVGKWAAFLLTGSTAIYSDAAESVVHIAATGIAAFSLWYAARPADPEHTYGHGKIAFFSAGLEGGLILIASISILYTAINQFVQGPSLAHLGAGVAITGGLAVVNLALGTYLVRVGRQHDSLVLVANGKHVLTDMWTSAGVVVGVLVVWLTDVHWIDPLVGLIVGAHVARSGFQLLRQSYDGLMDRADAEEVARTVAVLQAAVESGLISDFHQLRLRHVENEVWIDLHLLLPGNESLASVHSRATEVENRVKEAMLASRVQITSHLEPADHARAHPEGHEGADPIAQ